MEEVDVVQVHMLLWGKALCVHQLVARRQRSDGEASLHLFVPALPSGYARNHVGWCPYASDVAH